MKTFNRLAALAAALGFLASAHTASAEIRFGFAAEPFPPFMYKDSSGQWAGWEVDVMAAVCTELKETCTSADVAWDGLIPALQSNQFDVIWASMSITDKRKEAIAFTAPYYDTRVQLIGAKTGDTDVSPAHLAGKTIGVQVATIHQRYAEKYYVPAGVKLKTYQTEDEANQDLAAGRVDYVQGAAPALDAFLQSEQGKACCELKSDVVTDRNILGEGVGGGLRKDDVALKQKLDGAIAALAKNGGFDKITAKYPGLAAMINTPK